MHVHHIPAGKVIALDEHLAELIINEGVEMNLETVDQIYSFLLEHFGADILLLINKQYPYSFTFDAQRKIGALQEIKKTAIVVYNEISKRATQGLLGMRKEHDWNACIFEDRDTALAWLRGPDSSCPF